MFKPRDTKPVFSHPPNTPTLPSLPAEEQQQFHRQFTMFSDQLDLRRLKESVMLHNYQKSHEPLLKFLQYLLTLHERISFEDYLQEMQDYFTGPLREERIMEVVDEERSGEIHTDELRTIMEEYWKRKVEDKEWREFIKEILGSEEGRLSLEDIREKIGKVFE